MTLRPRPDIDPALWGPRLWGALHAVAECAPEDPSEEEKTAFTNLIDALPYILPCAKCRAHLAQKFETGLKPEYGSGGGPGQLKEGMWKLHNAVNADIGAKIRGPDACYESFAPVKAVAAAQSGEDITARDARSWGFGSNALFFLFFISLICLLIYQISQRCHQCSGRSPGS